MKVYIHNLGCDKNRVDGEKLAGRLSSAGFSIVSGPDGADLVVVNTCGFIEEAKRESLETVFGFARDKKVVVAGCLSERYPAQLKKQVREADLVLGLADKGDTAERIIRKYGGQCHKTLLPGRRILTGNIHTAPIKIAEGCSNRCSYCAIPLIRGRHVSRPENEILREARILRKQGVKELILVAQDITAYGERKGLPALVRKLSRLSPGFEWIRLMYCHPAGISDELIDTVASEKAVAKYIDMPLQHIADPLLKRMNRHYNRKYIESVIRKLRERVPGIALRTTFIAGFPGETRGESLELFNFAKETEFDRMGVFAYSPEEGTRASKLPSRISARTVKSRMEELLFLQNDIIFRKNCLLAGKTLKVLIDEEIDGTFVGRTERDAPEVDCNVLVSGRKLKPGGLYDVKIVRAVGLDLYA